VKLSRAGIVDARSLLNRRVRRILGAVAEAMRVTSITFTMLVFAAAVGVLFVVYPWSIYYGCFDFSWWTTVSSYFVVALGMGALAVLSGRFCLRLGLSPVRAGILRAATMLTVEGAAAVVFGPMGLDVPGTRVRGIFFAEWKFVTFFFYAAAPVSMLAGLLCGMTRGARDRRTTA